MGFPNTQNQNQLNGSSISPRNSKKNLQKVCLKVFLECSRPFLNEISARINEIGITTAKYISDTRTTIFTISICKSPVLLFGFDILPQFLARENDYIVFHIQIDSFMITSTIVIVIIFI